MANDPADWQGQGPDPQYRFDPPEFTVALPEQPDTPPHTEAPDPSSVQPGASGPRRRLTPGRVFLAVTLLVVLTVVGVYQGVVRPELSVGAGGMAFRFDLPWWLSDRVRQLDEDTDFSRRRLRAILPYSTQSPAMAGYHSAIAATPETPQWVQVDLGREYLINEIALVPASLQHEELIDNFAFPRRFRVQISTDPEFRTSTLVADNSSTDYPAPGRYPCFIPAIDLTARYVRVTVTQHVVESGRPVFALGELIVLSGKRNVAAWRPVRSTGSQELSGRWSREYLVDGISILPAPVGVPLGASSSLANGYLMVAAAHDDAVWVQLDLGRPHTIDEIRLIPAHSPGNADVPGWGFPAGFRVEVANDPGLTDAVPYAVYRSVERVDNRPLIVPAETRHMLSRNLIGSQWEAEPADYPADSVDARYVRITATQYDPRLNPPQFALAEVQVYSGDSNVAINASVTASDVESGEVAADRLEAQYLVDEFSSESRLLEYPVWLDHLKKRRRLEEQLAQTNARLDEEVNLVWMQLGVGVGLALIVTVGGMLWYTRWQTASMQTQTVELRNQIASDLHDDIGSNLGAIALLCQTISIRGDIPDGLHDEFAEIREVALETSDSMRDIVWLMRTSTSGLSDFVGRLRATSARMLHQCEVTFHDKSEHPDVAISLNWRRNVFLSFKEVLHNAARHSNATQVRIELEFDADRMRIFVKDNGIGFDLQTRREGGLGVNSISARTRELGGNAEFQTAPGQGTAVTLEIPFVHPGNLWGTLMTRLGRRWSKWTEHEKIRRLSRSASPTRSE